MMGDNRDNSEDSRYWGFLPQEYVKGRALFVYFSFGQESGLSGLVTGVCTPVHLGRSMTVHEIVVTDEDGRRCSTVRITNHITDLPAS